MFSVMHVRHGWSTPRRPRHVSSQHVIAKSSERVKTRSQFCLAILVLIVATSPFVFWAVLLGWLAAGFPLPYGAGCCAFHALAP